VKTALELLGYKGMRSSTGFVLADLELVVQRAREEMREMAAQVAEEWCAQALADQIRALPVSP
jgi:hypothetical protein